MQPKAGKDWVSIIFPGPFIIMGRVGMETTEDIRVFKDTCPKKLRCECEVCSDMVENETGTT